MKQYDLFGNEFTNSSSEDAKYTRKIESPVYEPKNAKPNIFELADMSKSSRLIVEINNSDATAEEKKFLIAAAQRHNVFNYEKIADYYAHASPVVQRLFERSALVIIDFEQAIQLGYVQVCEEIERQYLTEYAE